MSLEAIKGLPVATLAAPDCFLFLWATMPMLPEAFEVMSAWGFRYRTVAFTWAKTTKHGKPFVGMGYYTRANAELCLLGTRGRPQRKSRAVRQLILSAVGRHSAKPAEQYERIEALAEGPYCELFARNVRPGWAAWGRDVPDVCRPLRYVDGFAGAFHLPTP